jgi:hypothetical protein
MTARDEPQRDTGYCPECGAEVWDQVEVCPKCSSIIGGDVLHRPPVERWWRQRWRAIVVVAILIALTMMLFRLRL